MWFMYIGIYEKDARVYMYTFVYITYAYMYYMRFLFHLEREC